MLLNFTILQSGIDTIIVKIAEFYDMEVNEVQWLNHSSNLGICMFGIIANKLYQKFNVINCYRINAIGSSIFLLLAYFMSLIEGKAGLVCLNIMYFLASSFVSQVYPGTVPISNFFIKDKIYGIPKTLSYTDCIAPLGYFIGSLVAGILAQYSDWRYLFLIVGIINSLFTIIFLMVTEHQQYSKNFQIDIYSTIIIMSAVATTIIGSALLNTFSDDLKFIEIPILILIISTILYVLFAYRNKNISLEKQVFRKEVLNKNTVNFVSFFIVFSIGATSDNFFVPIIWRQLFNYSSIENALLISLCKFLAFLLIKLYSFIISKVTTTYIERTTTFVYTLIYIFQILQLEWFMNIYTTEITNILVAILFTQTQVAIQSYNVIGSPGQFGYISSSIIGFTGRFANSIGLGLSTSIQTITKQILGGGDNEYITSIVVSYAVGAIIVFISFFMSLNIGVLRYEIKRLGYSEQMLDRTMRKTYEELKSPVASAELIESQEYSDVGITQDSVLMSTPLGIEWVLRDKQQEHQDIDCILV